MRSLVESLPQDTWNGWDGMGMGRIEGMGYLLSGTSICVH